MSLTEKEKFEKFVNLCDHCIHDIPTCSAEGLVFGLGKGNDNVLDCDVFKENIWPKTIQLYKLETKTDAEVPQEEKYPSGTVIKGGYMWEHTLPVVGKQFYVMAGKVLPSLHTSDVLVVEKVKSIGRDHSILIETRNSKYEIRWAED